MRSYTFSVLLCLTLLFTFSVISGCTLAGFALGESYDVKTADENILSFVDDPSPEFNRKLFALRYRTTLLVMHDGRNLKIQLSDYSLGKYIDVLIPKEALFPEPDHQRITWDKIDKIVLIKKSFWGRSIGFISGLGVDFGIIYLIFKDVSME